MTCDAMRQGDEMFCPTCDMRWSFDEDPPRCRSRRVIVGISGAAGSGKSTVADHLVRNHGFVRLKFAGALKAMMRALLLETGAEPDVVDECIDGYYKDRRVTQLSGQTPRHAMQTLGTEWGRQCMGGDFWVDIVRSRIMTLPETTNIVIDDVRFENEAALIRRCGGTVLHLTGRGGIDSDHLSETPPTWDVQYRNDGTVEELTGWVTHVVV